MNTTVTVQDWEALAEAVREELRESAWLFSLLGQQQRAILERDVDAIFAANAEIDEQATALAAAREARLRMMDGLTTGMDLQPRYSLAALAARLPASFQPLYRALADEAAALLQRVDRRTRQNQHMLNRACEAGHDLIEMLRPGSQSRTYNRKGAVVRHTAHRGNVVHTAV